MKEKPQNAALCTAAKSHSRDEPPRTLRVSLVWLGRWLALAGMFWSVAACSDTKEIQWKEMVKLSDNSVIQVSRSRSYRSVYAGGSARMSWLAMEEKIEATMPINPPTLVKWQGELQIIAIDMDSDGRVILVGAVVTRQGRRKYQLKDGENHVALKLSSTGEWDRILITNVPPRIHSNLYISARKYFLESSTLTSGIVDLETKARMDKDPTIDRSFRTWPSN